MIDDFSGWAALREPKIKERSGICSFSLTIPGALLTAGGLGAAGSVASSVIGSNAAQSAAKTQANAADQAAQIQQNEFNTTTANEAPFLKGGQNSLSTLLSQLGLGSGGTGSGPLTQTFTPFSFNPQNLQNTPGYQFQFQQGEQAIQDAQSAVGGATGGPLGIGGGNTLKALTQFGQGLAGTEYQQAYQNAYQQWLANQQGNQNVQQQNFNNLQTLAGSGQNAAANLGALGNSAASTIGNDLTSGAAATAAGTVGAANAAASGLSGVTNALSGAGQNYLLYSLLSGGGLGGSSGGIAAMGS